MEIFPYSEKLALRRFRQGRQKRRRHLYPDPNAKLNGLNVEAYLRHVINVIPDHPIKRIEELLPWNVKL